MNISNIYCAGMQSHVTLDIYIIAIHTNNIAIIIFKNVHVDNAIHCIDSSVIKSLIFVNSNIAALNINYSTAAVSYNTIGIALEVNITVNGNSAALA